MVADYAMTAYAPVMAKWARKRVRELRYRLGLSQTELGKLLGVSLRTVQSIEGGERLATRTQSLALSYVEQEGVDA